MGLRRRNAEKYVQLRTIDRDFGLAFLVEVLEYVGADACNVEERDMPREGRYDGVNGSFDNWLCEERRLNPAFQLSWLYFLMKNMQRWYFVFEKILISTSPFLDAKQRSDDCGHNVGKNIKENFDYMTRCDVMVALHP